MDWVDLDFPLQFDDALLAGCPGSCPLPVRRVENATVAWINYQWLFNQGVRAEPRSLEEALVGRFAYELEAGKAENVGKRDRKNLWADGYGTTSLARYGGSGRAGVINGFQIKGVGRTPLAAANADWHHSHGFLWLEEGLREAVFSEVCRAESPVGAVPVVAVLALPERVQALSGEWKQRALLVRPFFTRPAHLQRSLLLERFDLGNPITAHVQDAARVRWYVNSLEHGQGGPWQAFNQLALAYGQQAAYAHLQGWFSGGFTSSNLTILGHFIDFGSARFVNDGRAVTYEGLGQRYGDELHTANAVLESVSFFIKKYAVSQDVSGAPHEYLMAGYRRELVRQMLQLLGSSRSVEDATPFCESIEMEFQSARRSDSQAHSLAHEEEGIERSLASLYTHGDTDVDAAVCLWRERRIRRNASREAVQEFLDCLIDERPSLVQKSVDHLIQEIAKPVSTKSREDRKGALHFAGGVQAP